MTRNYNLQPELPRECRCVPNSPFYVRWLNRFGGIDYWMFSKRQTYQLKQTGQEVFNPRMTDLPNRIGTNYPISKELTSTLVVGAQSLNNNEWEELTMIGASPFVQHYSEEADKWYDCIISKADNTLQSDDGNHAMELTIKLADLQLQF